MQIKKNQRTGGEILNVSDLLIFAQNEYFFVGVVLEIYKTCGFVIVKTSICRNDGLTRIDHFYEHTLLEESSPYYAFIQKLDNE